MSAVKRLQEELRIVNIRFIEAKLLDGLNLAGNPSAQLRVSKGRSSFEFHHQRAESLCGGLLWFGPSLWSGRWAELRGGIRLGKCLNRPTRQSQNQANGLHLNRIRYLT